MDDVIRKYAVAEDRLAVVNEQIKGTEEHFFLSVLHQLNLGNPKAAQDLLQEWERAAAKNRYRPQYLSMLKNWCMLALYDKQPGLALEHFKEQFGTKQQVRCFPAACLPCL